MTEPDMFATLERTTRLVEEGNPDEAYRVMKTAVEEDTQGFGHLFLSEWMKHIENSEESVQNKFAEILIFLKDDFPELATGGAKAAEGLAPSVTAASPSIATSHVMPVWLAPLDKPVTPKPAAKEEVVTPAVSAEPAPAPEPVKIEPTVEEIAPAQPEPVEPEPAQAEVKEEEQPQVQVEPAPVTPEPEPAPQAKVAAPEPVVELEPSDLEQLTLTFYEWQMSAIHKAAMKEKVDENVLLTRMLATRKLDPLMWSRYRQGKTSSPSRRITIAVPHKVKAKIEKEKNAEGIKTTTRYIRKVLFGARAEKA